MPLVKSHDRRNLPAGSVLIVGGGLAALWLALKLSPRPVTIISPTPLGRGASSAWAQGGISGALGAGDTPAAHMADTLAAGCGLCDAEAVAVLTNGAAAEIHALADLGVPFDRDDSGAFHLSLEAAHSVPRVARVSGDGAGKSIMAAVIAAVRTAEHIQTFEGWSSKQLLQDSDGVVRGVTVQRGGGGYEDITASDVVLATGGVGGLYAVATTPPEVWGAGLAMASSAGAVIRDAEFVQFHPTALNVGRTPAPLVTESLRGAGARLVNADGARFMTRYHPKAELAPRDVAARAIHAEIAAGRGAFLDARDAVGARFPQLFPTVYATCLAQAIDPTTDLIPVAPAAHYHMGGVATDTHGRTTLAHLWAVGEAAATGVHGANRLASNSLLECLVFADRTAQALLGVASTTTRKRVRHTEPPWPLPLAAMQDVRTVMSTHVGVVRDADGLNRALETIEALERRHGATAPTSVARIITTAALMRHESRGAHFRSDYPQTDTAPRHSDFTHGAPRTVEAEPA
jgi:L-aspartate oxidase